MQNNQFLKARISVLQLEKFFKALKNRELKDRKGKIKKRDRKTI